MARLSTLMLIAMGCTLGASLNADTLQMGGTENAARFENAGKPSRGMTQSRVEATFGSPQQAHAAVGDPPITRWDYPAFVVFFEYDRVIHAVTRR